MDPHHVLKDSFQTVEDRKLVDPLGHLFKNLRPPLSRDCTEWNTRQESNLRALGSKPNGDAGKPLLVYWIRRHESGLRGLPVGREGYSLAGVPPRPTLQFGAQCRLSACDIRFVGTNSAQMEALCLALRLPVSIRRIVACAGLWAGVSRGLRAGSEALVKPVCPRPCAGGKANQSSIVPTRD